MTNASDKILTGNAELTIEQLDEELRESNIMKPLKSVYPLITSENEDDSYFLWQDGDYNNLLLSMEFEIIIKKDDDDYQGDSFVLFADTVKGYGYLTFG